MRECGKSLKLYDKVKDTLKEQIVSGIYKPSELLPCSEELSAKYKVSLITIRRALTELQSEGLILLHQGRRAEIADTAKGRAKVFFKTRPKTNIFVILAPSRAKALSDNSITSQSAPWTYTIFSGVQSELMNADVSFSLIRLESPMEIPEVLKNNSSCYDGVIIFAANLGKTAGELIPQIKKPYCLISGQTEFNSVCPDYYNGSSRVAEYFLNHNMENFLFLKTSLSGVSLQKMRGFQEGLLFNGVSPDRIHIVHAENIDAENSEKAVLNFLNAKSNIPPMGIFTAGDYMAAGAANACKKKGLKLIQDYMVIASTGLKEAESFSPKLSVLADPMFETGREASKMVLDMIKNKSMREPSVILSMEFVHRETTILSNNV
ncbi:MAG: hypothetical protein A2017_01795 [Lentisphaerae bacterium GWF2_44_16]|nr:MAG: hypothetical protein A2017_01795 [Lentisphaerae bacterium GWF2_44_16]